MQNNYQVSPQPEKNGLATASLVLGILSIIFGAALGFLFVPAIIGLVMGIIGVALATVGNSKGQKATSGMATSIIGLVICFIFTASCSAGCAACASAAKDGAKNDVGGTSTVSGSTPEAELEDENNISLPVEKPMSEASKYSEGTYKIGADLPAGIYCALSNGSPLASITVKDGSDSDANVIAFDSFDENSIIEVTEGQYLTVRGSDFCEIEYTKPLGALMLNELGHYPAGSMWLTGFHIPSGEYKLLAEDDAPLSSATIYADAKHTSPTNVVLISGSSYVTLRDGEYIALRGATLNPIT